MGSSLAPTVEPATAASSVIDWLLDPAFPAVRRLTLLGLLGRGADDRDVRALDQTIAADPWITRLLAGEWRAGAAGRVRVHPYKKWGGAHWRLVALAELGITASTPRARAALDEAFDETAAWLLSPGHVRNARPIDGRVRICGSKEGLALWAAATIGLGSASQLDELAAHLLGWQWPDGGWNCDVRPAARHASFNESWGPLLGLAAYRRRAASATRAGGKDDVDAGIEAAVDGAAQFLLRHRVVESERTGELANPHVGLLRWPAYWHYGLLPGLRALDEAGRLGDPRVRPALDRLRAARQPDGTWRPDGRWWDSPRAKSGANVEIVDWGRDGEARLLTLESLEILAAADATANGGR
jgi:hypothetical protein